MTPTRHAVRTAALIALLASLAATACRSDAPATPPDAERGTHGGLLRGAPDDPAAVHSVVGASPDAPPVPATPEPGAGRTPPHAAFTAEISAEQFVARNAHLASEELQGRESGTPGGALAEEYVAAELARLGLVPAGAGASQFQDVPMPWRPVLMEECSFEVRRAGDDAPARIDGTVPFSMSKPGEAVFGVAFAGYGLSSPADGYDDFAGLDLRGKAALILRHGPREDQKESPWFLRRRDAARMTSMSFENKAKRAVEAGAAAVLFVNDRHHKGDGLPTTSAGDSLPVPVVAIPRDTANRILRAIGKEIADLEAAIDKDMEPHSCDIPGVTVALRVTLGDAYARNVLYALPGTDAKLASEIIVLSAHVDHVGLGWFGSNGNGRGQVHNGADDNASGTAAMLEVAEALAAGPPMRRTVLVAGWCGEEKGLVGSQYWCTHPTRDLAQVVANVNLDMVGHYRDTTDDDVGLAVVGIPTGSTFTAHVDAANRDEKLRVTPSWEAWEQSDHFSVYQKKIPVLFLHTGLHPDYHRPGDDWWKVDAKDAARIARFTADLVRRLADDDARPEYMQKPLRAVLGVALGDADGGAGAALGQVFPAMAAANAGLLAGDVVVEADGTKIGTARDLSKVLAAHKPGEEIDVVFRRGGKETKTRVKLSGR